MKKYPIIFRNWSNAKGDKYLLQMTKLFIKSQELSQAPQSFSSHKVGRLYPEDLGQTEVAVNFGGGGK